MKTFVDGIKRESEKIYRAKLDALSQGNEAVTQQVGEGKDVLSILGERSYSIGSRSYTHSEWLQYAPT